MKSNANVIGYILQRAKDKPEQSLEVTEARSGVE